MMSIMYLLLCILKRNQEYKVDDWTIIQLDSQNNRFRLFKIKRKKKKKENLNEPCKNLPLLTYYGTESHSHSLNGSFPNWISITTENQTDHPNQAFGFMFSNCTVELDFDWMPNACETP